jgi:hypothetical protein
MEGRTPRPPWEWLERRVVTVGHFFPDESFVAPRLSTNAGWREWILRRSTP